MVGQQAFSLEPFPTCREVGLEEAHRLWSLPKVVGNTGPKAMIVTG